MVVWTILVHFGPAHFPTVPRPRPRTGWPEKVLCAKLSSAVSGSYEGIGGVGDAASPGGKQDAAKKARIWA